MTNMLPDRPTMGSLSEAELLVFLLDGSGSMCNPDDGGTATYDGRTKAAHLCEIAKEVLSRLNRSEKRDTFRVALVYFAVQATIVEVEAVA
jgi:hypothetical protein